MQSNAHVGHQPHQNNNISIAVSPIPFTCNAIHKQLSASYSCYSTSPWHTRGYSYTRYHRWLPHLILWLVDSEQPLVTTNCSSFLINRVYIINWCLVQQMGKQVIRFGALQVYNTASPTTSRYIIETYG